MEPSEEMFIAKSLERIAVALEEHNLHAAEAMQQQQRQIELQQSSQKLVREDLELRRDLAAKADDEKNQFLKLFQLLQQNQLLIFAKLVQERVPSLDFTFEMDENRKC